MNDLLTLREVADRAGLSYELAKQRIRRRGVVPAMTPGNSYLFTSDVPALIAEAGWREWLEVQRVENNTKGEL